VDTQTVVILDFGSQYTQLIARRIREQNVFSVVLPCTAPLSEIEAYKPIGLILSGGPSSVYDIDAPDADPRVLAMGIPTLGVCYGLHFIVHHMGGKVRLAPKREYGHAEVQIEDGASQLFAGLPPSIQVWMSHGDEAEQLPPGFRRVAVTENALAGIANEERRIWAVQFHPEVHHTPLGPQLIKNFVFQRLDAEGADTRRAAIYCEAERGRRSSTHGGVGNELSHPVASQGIRLRAGLSSESHELPADPGGARRGSPMRHRRPDELGMVLHAGHLRFDGGKRGRGGLS